MKRKQLNFNVIAILVLFTFSSAGANIGPALQTCIEAWPSVSPMAVRMLTTLPSVFSIVVMLIVSKIVGKVIKYKTAVLIGCFIVITAGIMPFFYSPSWSFVLVCNSAVGIGDAFWGMRTALLIKSVSRENRDKLIGISSSLFIGMSVIISPIVGILADISWRHAFLINLYPFLIMLLCIFFMKEPKEAYSENDASKKALAEHGSARKDKIDRRIWLYAALQIIASTIIVAPIMGNSTFVAVMGIGTAATAGFLQIFTSLGGVLINLFYAPLKKLFGRFILSLGFIMQAVGVGMYIAYPSALTIGAGFFIAGAGFFVIFTTLQSYVAQAASPSDLTFCSSLILALNEGGMFLAPYYIALASAIFKFRFDVLSANFASVLIMAFLAVLLIFTNKIIIPDAKNNI